MCVVLKFALLLKGNKITRNALFELLLSLKNPNEYKQSLRNRILVAN